MDYYVLLVDKDGDSIARVIGTAPTSSAARNLAQALDIKQHGRITGRTFYLDQEALVTWRSRGKIAPIGSLVPELDVLGNRAGQ